MNFRSTEFESGARLGARRARRCGFALLVVLFFVILLSVAAGGYAIKMNTSHRLALSRAESWRLLFAARAAVEEAKARQWRQAYGVSLESLEDEGSAGVAAAGTTDKSAQGILKAPEAMTLNLEGVRVTVEFEDEAGKLPVNNFASAGAPESKSLTNALVRLFGGLDLSRPTGLATAVRDFIDRDSKGTGERGAANGPVFHISQLAGAKGFSADTLYAASSEELPPLAWCLTTWHSGKVNVNSASAIVLSAIAPRLTDGEIEGIIAARAESPFTSAGDMGARSGISADAFAQLSREIGFKTDTLSLYIEATGGVLRRRVTAVVWVEPSAAHTLYFGEGWDF